MRAVPRLCELYTGIYSLQLGKSTEKPSVRVAEDCILLQNYKHMY